MAYPQRAAVATSNEPGNETTHTINLPSGIVADSLVLVFVGTDGDISWSNLNGFTGLKVINNGTAGSCSVMYKYCTGSEGSTVDFISNESEQSTHISWRITGDAGSGTIPEVSTGVIANSQFPDPDELIPTGGAKDYLWIPVEGNDDDDAATAYPLPDNNTTNIDSGGCGVSVCSDELNQSSLNPGTFTLAGTEQWVACTVVVHPEAGLTHRTLEANAGSYSVTGIAINPLYGRKVKTDVGSYAVSGISLDLLYGREIQAEVGSYAISGIALDLLYDKKIPIDIGSYSLSGTALDLLYGRKLQAGVGSYGLSGQDVNLDYSGTAWLTGWGFRKELTVQHANVDSNLTDFPVYVKIDADADFHESLATGFDIRFTQSDGTTLLKYEREYWTGGNGSAATAHFWVKVPSILAAGGTTIYIYYGKAGAADGEDAANVWDANFAMVHHLTDETTSTVLDSTSNNNDGTKTSANNPIEYNNGKVYKAQDFISADTINCGTNASLDVQGGDWAVEAWVYHDVTFKDSVVAHQGSFWLYLDASDKLVIEEAVGWTNITSTGTVGNSAWHHVVITNKQSDDDTDLYIDGSLDASGGTLSIAMWASTNFRIGSYLADSQNWDGKIDEVRLHSSLRSGAWFKFTHANINEADQELTWAAEEAAGGAPYTLTCAGGSYALTGIAVNPLYGRKVFANGGSYAVTGIATGLLHDKKIPIDVGSYAVSGQAANLLYGRKLGANAGSYAITGTALDLLYGRKILAGAGGYAVSGIALDLLHDKKILAALGSYALTGSDVTLIYSGGGDHTLTAVAGSYALTGQVVSLLKNNIISISAGSYLVTGQAASLLRGLKVSAEAGAYLVTGQAAQLLLDRIISVSAGNYTLTGQDLALLKGSVIAVEEGSFILTGLDVTLDYSAAVVYPIIFDVESRERMFDVDARKRTKDVPPRVRIFDVKRRG